MTRPGRSVAIRFVHPDFSRGDPQVGLRLDLRGRLELADERDSVRQALLLLFSTSPGERVMRPDYGCDLMRLVHAPNDDTTAGLAIHYVRRAIARWEPRIEVVGLDAVRRDPLAPRGGEAGSPEHGELHILLEYRLKPTQETDTLVFSLSLSGERR